MIWIDVGERMSRDEICPLKFGLVRNWENSPNSFPSPMELEAWAKTTRRLKGNRMVAHMNNVQFFLEFTVRRKLSGLWNQRGDGLGEDD